MNFKRRLAYKVQDGLLLGDDRGSGERVGFKGKATNSIRGARRRRDHRRKWRSPLLQERLTEDISRAQVLAVVVGDPWIAQTAAINIEGMRRLNLYCRLVQDCQKTA